MRIELTDETEGPTGWTYNATVELEGRAWDVSVTLAYADYDRWSRGAHPPADVVTASIRVAFDAGAAPTERDSIDVARLARTIPDFDGLLAARLD